METEIPKQLHALVWQAKSSNIVKKKDNKHLVMLRDTKPAPEIMKPKS